MQNFMIILIIIIMIVIGIIYTVKHFKGESSCCGGGSYKPKKKKLKNIKYTKIFKVEGMHCEHCKNRVEEMINDINGLAGTVNLKKNELTVFYEIDTEDSVLKARLGKAGYILKI